MLNAIKRAITRRQRFEIVAPNGRVVLSTTAKTAKDALDEYLSIPVGLHARSFDLETLCVRDESGALYYQKRSAANV